MIRSIRPSSLVILGLSLATPGCFVSPEESADDDSQSGVGGSCGQDVLGGVGDSCRADTDCERDLICSDGYCDVTRGGTKEVGESCTASMECVPGSVCFNQYCVGQGALRISLGFSVDSDFDLHVLTPLGSEIYYANRIADGGELDVDQCVSSCGSLSHAENVTFDTAPSGTYEIWVLNYDGRGSGPFNIEVAGATSRTFMSSLPATSHAESQHFTFTR